MSTTERDPRRERQRVALAFALAVVPPLVLLAILSVQAARHDKQSLRDDEIARATDIAKHARDAVAQGVRAAEQACFPQDLGKLRSREPASRVELEQELDAIRRSHPIARRFVALDEDGKLLLPDSTLPFRADAPTPDEDEAAASPEAFLRRAAAAQEYARARELEGKHDLLGAAGVLLKLADDPDAPAPLRVRAARRLGRDLEAAGELGPALAAYARAASAPVPAREDGIAVRPEAALHEAELLRARGDGIGAYGVARDLARALLAGAQRDLTSAEWDSALSRARRLVDDVATTWSGSAPAADGPAAERWAAPTTGARLLAAEEQAARERIAWIRDLEGDLGEPLRASLAEGGPDDLLHLSSLKERVVIAYRVIPALPIDPGVAPGIRTKRLLLGVEIDLDRLARDVIAPLCADESFRAEGITFAVLDGHARLKQRVGAATLDEQGHGRPDETVEASVPLEPPPLWQLRTLLPTARIDALARRRMILFASLVALAVVATFAGGTATFRSVARSLELARMKQDFVSNVTHELKTPLTSIKMYAETLSLGRARDDEKKKEYLAHIIRESDRLQRLIDDILDFARLGEGKRPFVLAEGDVTECAREALVLFRHSAEVRGFEVFVDLPALGAMPPVDLDRDAIVRCILNLLSNAVKYSGDGRYVRLAVKREKDMIATSVEDRGIGIDPEDLDRIFERFYRVGDHLTREVSGAGLGLALVDEVVRSHGGQIRVESTKGKGSTFSILLPIVVDYRNVPWPPPDSEVGQAPVSDAGAAGGAGASQAAESETRTGTGTA